MNRTALWLAALAALIAVDVVAEVSAQYRDWGNTGLRYLMMKQEQFDWASLKTDADAKAFIELFWARRDPTPDTPVNELRQQFETRIAEADKRFTVGKKPGSQTDHGLVYVFLGQPTRIVPDVLVPRGQEGSIRKLARPINVESWIYQNEAAERAVGTQSFDILFRFTDEKFGGEFELDGNSQRAFETTALALARRVVKRPFLTAAELGGESARTVPLRMIIVSDKATAYDILRRAQEKENFADLARKYSSHPSAQQGGYVGRVLFASLDDDFKVALAGKEPGAAVLIARSPQYAIVQLLTEADAAAADAQMQKPK
jgi:GWxTD domain-containing protein